VMCASPYADTMVNGPGHHPARSRYLASVRRRQRLHWAMPTTPWLAEDDQNAMEGLWTIGFIGFCVAALTVLGNGFSWGSLLFAAGVLGLLTLLMYAGISSHPSSPRRRTRWLRALLLASMNPVACAVWSLESLGAKLWLWELRRDGLLRNVEKAIDDLLGDDRGTLLVLNHYEGLRDPHDAKYYIDKQSAYDLRAKMSRLSGGTIAVSGPRGVGKTMLIRHGVYKKGDFSVFAHAPATYAPHDFLLSLFVKVCEHYIDREGHDVPSFTRLSYVQRVLSRVLAPLGRLIRRLVHALPAIVLIGLGLVAAGRSFIGDHASQIHEYIDRWLNRISGLAEDVAEGKAPVIALILMTAGIVVWVLRKSESLPKLSKQAGLALLRLCALALLLAPFASFYFDPDFRGVGVTELFDGWQVLLLFVWLVFWTMYHGTIRKYVTVGSVKVSKRLLLGPPAVLLLPLLVVLTALDASTRPFLTDAENPVRLAACIAGLLLFNLLSHTWSFPGRAPKLVSDCRDHLYRLQTVQSSTAAMTSGATQFLTLGSSHSTAVTTVPPNYPLLVEEFRGVLTAIARTEKARSNRVIIAIDEVDRLGTDAKALGFLAEIKAILGVPHVYYLISVAEDVGAAFVRRGLPHRDVTDSSLDDVLHVQPCTLAESTEILTERAEGIGEAYIALAHVLSGGVPRDLVRYARRLVETQFLIRKAELTDVAQKLILEELSQTLAGFRTLLGKQSGPNDPRDALELFRQVAGHLRFACPCRARVDELRHVLWHFVAQDPSGLPDTSRQLIEEAAAYAYFSLTLLDVFGPPEFNQRRARAARRAPGGRLDAFAEARQELSLSPYSARTAIDAVRDAWELERVSAQGLIPAVIPPPRGTACPVHVRP